MARRLLRREKWTEMPPSMSGLGEVPFSHHWVGYWVQRGSSVGMESTLVLQGGGFRDLQGKLHVDLERARTHSWATIAWLPLNFISHLSFYSKMLPKKDIFGGCAVHPKAWPSMTPAARSSKGGCHGSPLFCVPATAGEPSGQVPAGSSWHTNLVCAKGATEPESWLFCPHISEYRHAKPPYSAIELLSVLAKFKKSWALLSVLQLLLFSTKCFFEAASKHVGTIFFLLPTTL